MRARSCPTCHSIDQPLEIHVFGVPHPCTDPWHEQTRPSHVLATSPSKPRPADPLVRDIADAIRHIEYNYAREGSGPGSRFEGRLLEDVQAEWIMKQLIGREDRPLPAGMSVDGKDGGQIELVCEQHGTVLAAGSQGLRTLAFEARRHWRESHAQG